MKPADLVETLRRWRELLDWMPGKDKQAASYRQLVRELDEAYLDAVTARAREDERGAA